MGFSTSGSRFRSSCLPALGSQPKSRLPLTVATHLSVVYAGFLVLAWQAGVPEVTQASLGPIAVPSGVGLYVMATILGTCLLSFAITHLLYFRAVREEIRSFRQFLVTAGPLWRWR